MKKIYLFIFILALGCQEAYDFCEVHDIFDDCSVLLPQEPDIPIDEQPMYAQSQACGGVGNTYGINYDFYFEFNCPADGEPIYWGRWKKQDDLTEDFNFFKYYTKDIIDTVYISTVPDYRTNFRAVIDSIYTGEGDLFIYRAPQIKTGFCGLSANNFPNPISDVYPTFHSECEGFAEIGDTLFITW